MGKASHHTTATIKTSKKDDPNKPINYQINQNSINGNPNPNSQINLNPNRRTRSTRNFIPISPPDFIHALHFQHSDHDHHDDSNDSDDDRVQKKLKLISNQVEKGSKATDTHTYNGTSKLVGPTSCTASGAAYGVTTTTSLPDRKLLLILDKLQKKDTRGVFAEPVDPEELPDYHEKIENPMDFGTVKKKLDGRHYSTLEQFEADIYLICSNAMQYNPPSSMFFRQARSIQELAKKEFETLRQEGGNCEPPLPKPKRGRPPGSRNHRKLLESSSVEHSSVPESSPDATPASRDNDATKSGSYNLRKGPSLYRFPRHPEFCLDSPASASKSMMTKYVKKQYESEENRRETYNPCDQYDSGQDPSLLTTFETFENRLIPVGLGSNHNYARSLALFAADLGPVVWRIVSKKIRSVLPPGVEFGPGWVGENKASSVQFSSPMEKTDCISQDSCMSKPHYPLNPGFSSSTIVNANTLEARRSSSGSEWPCLKGIDEVVGTGSSYQIQLDPVHSNMMNGFSGFGTGLPIQEGVSRPTPVSVNHSQLPIVHPVESTSYEASRNSNFNRMHSSPMNFHGSMNMENDPNTQGLPYWQQLSMQERWDNLNMAEPMVVSQASSSRMPIGSPPQLDLVLQL